MKEFSTITFVLSPRGRRSSGQRCTAMCEFHKATSPTDSGPLGSDVSHVCRGAHLSPGTVLVPAHGAVGTINELALIRGV